MLHLRNKADLYVIWYQERMLQITVQILLFHYFENIDLLKPYHLQIPLLDFLKREKLFIDGESEDISLDIDLLQVGLSRLLKKLLGNQVRNVETEHSLFKRKLVSEIIVSVHYYK